MRLNIVYSRKVLGMCLRDISQEFNINYNSVRNILKVFEDINSEFWTSIEDSQNEKMTKKLNKIKYSSSL